MQGFKLKKVDEVKLKEYRYLDQDDGCFYFGEYTARAGYGYSQTNRLIWNFKKPPAYKNSSDDNEKQQWNYKKRAIDQVARLINSSIPVPNPEVIFVPIPPSKTKEHPEYDDRLNQVLDQLKDGWMLNGYVDLITQKKSTEATHISGNRLDPTELATFYDVNTHLLTDAPKGFFIFDDVLTTGSHYKAVKICLQKAYPKAKIYGIFIARCEHIVD